MRVSLTLSRSPTGFVVHHPTLAHRLGHQTLPLPFTREATDDEVLLRRANPGRQVLHVDAEGSLTGVSLRATGP